MYKALVPIDFQIPEVLETERFRVRMLTINDVVKDYDAVMTSINYLQNVEPYGPNYVWPKKELTLEQDMIELGWHQREFQIRSSFAYTVVSLDEKECLGCMYIFPSPNSVYDAEIDMWIRESQVDSGLDNYLFVAVERWIKDKWPFSNPGYPGRKIDWQLWNELE